MFVRDLLKRLLYRLRGDYTTEELIGRGLVVGKNFNRLNGTIIDPSHCWLIHIGDNVTLAPRVHILAHDASTFLFMGYTRIGTVDIGDSVFVGAESVILPGVKIGSNVVIGANSTVTGDIPSGTVAVGSPARVICDIETFLARNRNLFNNSPVFGSEYTINGGISADMKVTMYETLRDRSGFVK